MGNDIDRITHLKNLITIVNEMLDSVPQGDATDVGVRAAVSRISHELEDRLHAKLGYAGGAYTIRLAGVGASCTVGTLGLLRGWQNAARRRIEKIQAGAA